jgi:hypothetical protein
MCQSLLAELQQPLAHFTSCALEQPEFSLALVAAQRTLRKQFLELKFLWQRQLQMLLLRAVNTSMSLAGATCM